MDDPQPTTSPEPSAKNAVWQKWLTPKGVMATGGVLLLIGVGLVTYALVRPSDKVKVAPESSVLVGLPGSPAPGPAPVNTEPSARMTLFAEPGKAPLAEPGKVALAGAGKASKQTHSSAQHSATGKAKPKKGATSTAKPKSEAGKGNGNESEPEAAAPARVANAYANIQSEEYDSGSGVGVYSIPGGGQKLGGISNGDRVLYRNVDFGSDPAHTFIVRQASGAASGISGLIEVRLDSPTASVAGSIAVANTGGWDSFRDVPGSLGGVTGTHDVYLTFGSGQPSDFADLDRFTFVH